MARDDSLSTILAVGVIAYVGETVGHELIGHGGVCLLGGGHITALAPLWMRCSVQTIPMVVAGPAFNFVAGGLCAALLRLRQRSDTFGYLLWLSCAFNLLVACGYLIVGGATTFGDWGAVFASVQPQWLWRLGLVAGGGIGYFAALVMLSSLYQRLAGAPGFEGRTLLRRTLGPGLSAAVVACAAELVGGRLGSLVLALGCTLFVGSTLGRIGGFSRPAARPSTAELVVHFRIAWLALGIVVAAAFVGVVGPVAFQGR